MEAAKTKILGSNYIGLFGIANDNLCFLPPNIDLKAEKIVAQTMDVKTVKTSLYGSELLSVFAKMNNKFCVLPDFVSKKEIETIEKEIKVKIIKTEKAIGNLIELNDTGAIISKTAEINIVNELKKENLLVEQMNLARTDAIGSALVSTNKGFVISPNATIEEIEIIEKTLKIKGGSSTANTGDSLIRNSILANKKGFIAGENTTGFELNRIDEALEQKE